MTTKLVLALDPGFASCGYAVLAPGAIPSEDRVVMIGVLRTKLSPKKHRVMSADDNIRRCREIASPLESLMVSASLDYIHRPYGGLFENRSLVRLVCAEKMSFPRNSSAAAKMAMTWGLIVGNLHRFGLPLVQASPQQVKKTSAGDSSATKDQVEKAMVKRFGKGLYRMLKGVPETQHEHAFDALAVGVTCLDSEEGRMVRTLG